MSIRANGGTVMMYDCARCCHLVGWLAFGQLVVFLFASFFSSVSVGGCSRTVSYDNARTSGANQLYWVEQIASGLKFPSSMVWLPNGDALILERQGGLRVLRQGALDPRPMRGMPNSFQNLYNGYKDIALDPDYQTSHVLFLLISEGTHQEYHAAIYRARFTQDGLLDVKRVFHSKDDRGGGGHTATRMQFLPDKTLLMGVAGDSPGEHDLSSHFGKILRIDRTGNIPADNPFVSTTGALPEIWSYGHRVQTGLHLDPPTGEIWEVEPGPRGGDELNYLKAGSNYGWPKATWGFDYSGSLAGSAQFGAGVEDPVLVWTPSSTPSSITRYRGATYPLWDGDFFVGHLSGKILERLRIENCTVVLREKMLMDLEERIRDVRVGPDNHIYILTDHQDGRLLRLRPGSASMNERERVAHKLTRASWGTLTFMKTMPDDSVKGQQVFLERCAGCHSVGSVVQGGKVGPDLAGVVGRKIGSKAGFNYSGAMTRSTQVWDLNTLNRFLADPDGYAPGTAMAAPPLTDDDARRKVLVFLEQRSAK